MSTPHSPHHEPGRAPSAEHELDTPTWPVAVGDHVSDLDVDEQLKLRRHIDARQVGSVLPDDIPGRGSRRH